MLKARSYRHLSHSHHFEFIGIGISRILLPRSFWIDFETIFDGLEERMGSPWDTFGSLWEHLELT